nr:peptide-methionine (S)-S-oxide reductase [Nannocystis exedens]
MTRTLSTAEGSVATAEDYHQQYLHPNPGGYCGLGGTGVSCPVGLASA